MMYCALNERVAAGWSRIGQLGILFIPASVYHFTLAALGNYERLKRRVWLIWEICLGFLLTVFTGNAFIRGITATTGAIIRCTTGWQHSSFAFFSL